MFATAFQVLVGSLIYLAYYIWSREASLITTNTSENSHSSTNEENYNQEITLRFNRYLNNDQTAEFTISDPQSNYSVIFTIENNRCINPVNLSFSNLRSAGEYLTILGKIVAEKTLLNDQIIFDSTSDGSNYEANQDISGKTSKESDI